MSEPDDPADRLRVNEEMVRKLLQMNPQLRGDGKSTKDVLSAVLEQTSVDKSAGSSQKPVSHASTAAKPAPAVNASDEIRKLRMAYEARVAQLKKEAQELASKTRLLSAQEHAAHEKACTRVIDAILKLDPDLLNKGNQVVLQQEEPFLKKIGYSAQKLLAEEKRRKGIR